jgi:hypothetical protein
MLTKFSSNSWSAISRGAVAKGLSNAVEDEIVTNVISKYSYGIAYSAVFDAKIHSIEDKYFCPIELVDKAAGQLRWYLKRVRLTPPDFPLLASALTKSCV